MTVAEMKAEIAKLKAEIAAQPKVNVITYKVSDKGALSAYGLGRFPVTLYFEQWERLDADVANRKAFMDTHKALFASKGVPYVKPVPVEASK